MQDTPHSHRLRSRHQVAQVLPCHIARSTAVQLSRYRSPTFPPGFYRLLTFSLSVCPWPYGHPYAHGIRFSDRRGLPSFVTYRTVCLLTWTAFIRPCPEVAPVLPERFRWFPGRWIFAFLQVRLGFGLCQVLN